MVAVAVVVAVACDIHAERHLAKAGGSNCKLRGIPTLATEQGGVERAERSGGLHKRSAEDWGNGLRARGGWPPSGLAWEERAFLVSQDGFRIVRKQEFTSKEKPWRLSPGRPIFLSRLCRRPVKVALAVATAPCSATRRESLGIVQACPFFLYRDSERNSTDDGLLFPSQKYRALNLSICFILSIRSALLLGTRNITNQSLGVNFR